MGISIERRKRIGKVLVLLLSSGSFLGISPLTAMAVESEDFPITVTVSDSSTPPCDPTVVPATWLPSMTPIFTAPLDVATTDPFPLTENFTVSLGFMDGFDPGCNTTYEPTGEISSSFVPNPDTGLVLESMECLEEPCVLATVPNDASDGELSGEFNVPQTAGTYDGTLTITWTP
jgi:hypothetical protein